MKNKGEEGATSGGFGWPVLAFVAQIWMTRPWAFASGTILSLIASGLDITLPWISGQLINAVSGSVPLQVTPWRLWIAFVCAYVFSSISQNLSSRIWFTLNALNMENLIITTFSKVQDFSTDWHSDNMAGTTVRRITRGMWGYEQVSNIISIWAGPGAITTLALAAMMLQRQLTGGIIAVGVAVAYTTLGILAAPRYLQTANLESNAKDAELGGVLADAVTSNATVKSFGAEGVELQSVKDAAFEWRAAILVTWSRFANLSLAQSLLLSILQAGVIGVVISAWLHRRATAGDIAFAIATVTLMSNRLRILADSLQWLQRGLNDTADLAAFAKHVPDVTDKPWAKPFAPATGKIAFENVTFAYDTFPPLYERFSISIAEGERVALVGPTGSGKSTFVRLIQRLHNLQDGRILIDGQDISQVQQRSLRQAIAVVPQDPALLHRSIIANIAFGRPTASMDEIISVAEQARAHEFIVKLPNGYDTIVGERGVKLSGGERQRIAIARALLIGAPILVLDEATSSLDVETEAIVQEAIKAVMSDRTTIIIAHRLKTIRDVDRIIVFENGCVVEEGHHTELVRRNGVYARLVQIAGQVS